MKDQIVSYETAKLAKEFGFVEMLDINKISYFYYGPNCISTGLNSLVEYQYMERPDIYLAPTQSLLQRWLREKYDLTISVVPFYDNTSDICIIKGYTYLLFLKHDFEPLTTDKDDMVYEEALEEGLLYALKLIK